MNCPHSFFSYFVFLPPFLEHCFNSPSLWWLGSKNSNGLVEQREEEAPQKHFVHSKHCKTEHGKTHTLCCFAKQGLKWTQASTDLYLFIYFLDKQRHVPKICSPCSVSVPVSTLLCLWTLLLPISEHPPNWWTYLCDEVIRNALFQIIRNDWFIWWHILHVILQADAASVLYLYHFNVKLWEILCLKYLWDWLMFF